ncbi:MAG TPA: hypothetical protein VGB69_12965 [Edaphobacter sp.]
MRCFLTTAALVSAALLPAQSPQPQIDLDSIDILIRRHIVPPIQEPCVIQDYLGPSGAARYVSKCSMPVHVTVVFGNVDDVKQFDLAPAKNHTTTFDIVDYANRKGSSWYVCPKGYQAVDDKGHPFKRPVSNYLCREIGS